jgi:probable HAF family extracellular repeat protein
VDEVGTLGGNSSIARAVAPSGEVVGWGYSAEFPEIAHAFMWTKTRGMVELGTVGGANSRAFDVSPSGDVVGQSQTATFDFHATLWPR